ncbi:MAG: Gx transporter family protein [Bacilli bacterium]|nr:Gx transporter family protein [Bacilli bacterium]
MESFLPDFLLPGMKIGLPNLVILLILYIDGFIPALTISLVRVVVVTLLRGSFLSMGGWMSFAGALASILIMALAKKLFRGASPVGVSLLGSCFHVAAQIFVAISYIGSASVLYYLPFMLLLAIGSGLAIGFLDGRIIAILRKGKTFA